MIAVHLTIHRLLQLVEFNFELGFSAMKLQRLDRPLESRFEMQVEVQFESFHLKTVKKLKPLMEILTEIRILNHRSSI